MTGGVALQGQISSAAPMLSLFGTAEDQHLLLSLVRRGQLQKPVASTVSMALRRSGLIAEVRVRGKAIIILDGRHPAYENIRAALAELAGVPTPAMTLSPNPRSEYRLDVSHPLAHRSAHAFRVLYYLVMSGEDTAIETLTRQLPHVCRAQVTAAVGELARGGIVDYHDLEQVRIAATVPHAYRDMVKHLGGILEERDNRLQFGASLPRHDGSFCRAEDGAPWLFGTDVRLRNLMALAKYGAMYMEDLKLITRVSAKFEDAGNAPFGRGALVRSWDAELGPAVDLDPAFPLKIPLRALLLKLEERYPLPPVPQYREIPADPKSQVWKGDKYALFGGAITTSILMTIGSLGWGFEALFVMTCVGYDRVVVKKAIKSLERAGLLDASRKRRPGFNVRVLRIANSFAARDELNRLLGMAVDTWPEFAERTVFAMKQLSPRTKAHLRKCGLPLLPPRRTTMKKWQRLSDPERRLDCVRQYCALTAKQERDLSSHELNRISSGLYRYIKSLWGSFAAFRAELRLRPEMTGVTQRPNRLLRERCVREYFKLTAQVGYHPNSVHLNQLDPWLSQCIRTQWGGFPQFCEELMILPARRHRSSTIGDAAKRRGALAEYRELERRLCHPPSFRDLERHTSGLYKRIRKLWGGLMAMRRQMVISPPSVDSRPERI